GSLCSYALDITTVDPIEYNLIFERFLNPERISMPDIDIDFVTDRRQEVIAYVTEKYGKDKTAQIITFNTMAAKACFKNVARVMQLPFTDANNISKMIPNEKDITLTRALEISNELKAVYDSNEDIKKIFDLSIKLEGMPSHAGTHAAGVVISKSPLTDFMPLQKNDDVVTTQFPMGIVEELGLLKMDFLGLRNLNVIQNTVEIIKRCRGEEINTDEIPFDDKAVYDMISKGDTDAVFQLESRGMQSFLKELRPQNFEDIIAGISLYRPGPMDQIPTYVKHKANPKKITYLHEKLKPILNMTYGCMVYQEQVMQIVRDLAGYSYGRSDLVRRAMAKKKHDVMNKERAVFIHGDEKEGIPGAVKNGVDEKSANMLFDQMVDFAEYAFNRSHAAAYGVISYQTAYLKCHYPAEFFAATINSYSGDNDKVARYVARCAAMGISTIRPDINISRCEFAVDGGNIVFGLLAIKNVGKAAAEAVVEERERNGKFKSFYDFCKRCFALANKRMIESMIYAGCFDSFGHNRSSLLGCYETLLSQVSSGGAGQMSLFDIGESGMVYEIKEKPEMDKSILLMQEKERTGVYLSGHPLDEYKDLLRGMETSVAQINDGEIKDNSAITIGGMVVEKRNHTTKNNDIMAFLEIEDLTGRISAVAFPKTLIEFSTAIGEGSFIKLTGRVSSEIVIGRNGEESEKYSIVMESAVPLKHGKKMQIKLTEYTDNAKSFFNSIQTGEDTLEIYLKTDEGWKKSVRKGLEINDELCEKAKKMFGDESIRIV
ncbi:MAG: DNA polymerase III subunit alpha, partial [Clostridia bacterium]|nr:DNA polymerase III subunit alpha [Clostridia bacterium]